MSGNRSFWMGATFILLMLFFLVVMPQYLGLYFTRYPPISLQVGFYLTSLTMGAMFLRQFRDRITCIWLTVAMLVNYSIFTHLITVAEDSQDLNIASLQATIVWALLLFCRGPINRQLFFIIGILPRLRPFARRYLDPVPPSSFQHSINLFIASCLVFDAWFTVIWRALPIYFGVLVEGSLRKTFDAHGWPNLFTVYYDLNNFLAAILTLVIPLFIILEALNNKKSP